MAWPYRNDGPDERYLYLKEESRLRDEEANDDQNDLAKRDRYYEESKSREEERQEQQLESYYDAKKDLDLARDLFEERRDRFEEDRDRYYEEQRER